MKPVDNTQGSVDSRQTRITSALFRRVTPRVRGAAWSDVERNLQINKLNFCMCISRFVDVPVSTLSSWSSHPNQTPRIVDKGASHVPRTPCTLSSRGLAAGSRVRRK